MDNMQLDHLENLSDDELSNLELSNLPVEEDTESESTDMETPPEESADEGADHQESSDEVPDSEQSEDVYESTAPESNDQLITGSEDQKTEHESIDYKAFYDQVTASFKANGKDMRVTAPQDIISLMQRGAGYAKKMASLKPAMRILRTLEQHGIKEFDIPYLVDLYNKKPEAIGKLVKDSNIDVYNLDGDNYYSSVVMPNDTEIELRETIDYLTENSPTFQDTLTVINKQWDEASREVIVNTPSLLNVLDQHAQSGIFDMILTEMDRLRTIGGYIDGMSDLDAYKKVGDDLNARGAFNALSGVPTQQQQTAVAPKPPTTPKAPSRDEQLADRKRAASSPKSSHTAVQAEPDYMNMSDEELEKLFPKFT